jgi:hypothetical protein
MNKKLLGLLMAGVLATTSLPAMSASAAEINTSASYTIEMKAVNGGFKYVLPDTELYYAPYSDCYSGTVADKEPALISWYKDKWYKVIIDGQTYYVYGAGHFE